MKNYKYNGIIKEIEYNSEEFFNIKDQIPKGVLPWCQEYVKCQKCNKVYWKGGYYNKLSGFIDKLRK